jgi:RNA polymerase sigma-70 factor, ECF subfamily
VADGKQAIPADRDLVVAMAAGDSEALRGLNARYGRMLAALARRFLSNESDAEEVVADVLWQAWRDAKAFDVARGSVSVWLVTLTRSRAIDRLRAIRVRKPLLDEQPASEWAPDPALELDQVERAHIIRTALAGLDSNERTALQLAYFSDLSQSEVAPRGLGAHQWHFLAPRRGHLYLCGCRQSVHGVIDSLASISKKLDARNYEWI